MALSPTVAVYVEVPDVSVDSEDEIFHATVTSGHSLQLACDVHAAQHLVWTRLSVSLHDIPRFKASGLLLSVVGLQNHTQLLVCDLFQSRHKARYGIHRECLSRFADFAVDSAV